MKYYTKRQFIIDTVILIVICGLLFFLCNKALGQKDSTPIRQEIFFSEVLGKYVLVTNNGELYDNVLHGSREFIEANKEVEFQNAIRRRKPILIIKVRCQ